MLLAKPGGIIDKRMLKKIIALARGLKKESNNSGA
jgi:hypothetical protein